MEFVDGEDLAQRLARGPLPIDEAIAIARQIADGLEAAHDQGIVPRSEAGERQGPRRRRGEGARLRVGQGVSPPELISASGTSRSADSPTVLSPSHEHGGSGAGTEMGLVLGTAAYMSPEQARGKDVDKRTDIWAFGCVLYQMLTGRTAFGGGTVSGMIAAVLKGEPDFSLLPPATPLPIRRLLERCLQRDPKRRLRDVGDAAIELDAAAGEAGAVDTVAHPVSWRRVALPALGILLLVAAASGAIVWRLMRPAPAAATRLAILPPADVELIAWNNHHTIAISPDGRRVAYFVGTRSGFSCGRSMDSRTRSFAKRETPGDPRFRPMASGSCIWAAR